MIDGNNIVGRIIETKSGEKGEVLDKYLFPWNQAPETRYLCMRDDGTVFRTTPADVHKILDKCAA